MVVQVDIHNTLGVLFVVTVITSMLYGAGMLQGWFYFRKYKTKDPWQMRSLVAFVLICDTIQQTMICQAMYLYAVSDHANPLVMTKMHKSIIIELFFGGALALAVQSFYCHRIYTLSKNYLLAGFIWFLALCAAVLVYAYTIIILGSSSLTKLVDQKSLSNAVNVLTAVSNFLITVCLACLLQKSKTGRRKPIEIFNGMMIFTFNINIPATVCAICDVITLNALPGTFVFMGFYLIMDRFFTNSLVISLNSRTYIRETTRGESSHESASRSEPRAIHSTHVASPPQIYNSASMKINDRISIRIDKQIANDDGMPDLKNYADFKSADRRMV